MLETTHPRPRTAAVAQRLRVGPLVAALAAGAVGCSGPQSALAPAGREARALADLFWWMTGGALVIWAAVVALTVYAVWVRPEAHPHRTGRALIIGGGVVFPTVVLLALLAWSLSMLTGLVGPAPADALVVHVTGEQYWWRVRYGGDAAGAPPTDVRGDGFELANELHLPAGRPAEILIDARDVIHSFWVPSLGGKMDAIPGRRTRLLLHPTRPGVYRGVCAEYCGASHAFMAFVVVVEDEASFAAWQRAQALPASPPDDARAARGASLFTALGCGACHTVRGTTASGVIGPDLTHVGSRASVGALRLVDNDAAAFARWLGHAGTLKPGVNMPTYSMITEEERAALAAYLESLQ